MTTRPETPVMDAVVEAVVEWIDVRNAVPHLAVDPPTFEALRAEADAVIAWLERETVAAEPPRVEPRLLTLGGLRVLVDATVEGWRLRHDGPRLGRRPDGDQP